MHKEFLCRWSFSLPSLQAQFNIRLFSSLWIPLVDHHSVCMCACVCWKKNRITGFLELWGCLSESQKSRWALKSLVHTPSLQTSCVYHESESACYVNPQRSEGDTAHLCPASLLLSRFFFPSLLTQSSNYLLLPVIELWLILEELGPQSASMFYSCL